MSIKVYCAYRLKKSKEFFPVINDIINQATISIQDILGDLHVNHASTLSTDTEEFANVLKLYGNEDRTRDDLTKKFYYNEYKEQLSSNKRNPFDFDVSIKVATFNKKIYLFPHCDMLMKNALNFLNESKSLEEYSYWDNVDCDIEGMTAAKWARRGKNYKDFFKSNSLDHSFIINILSIDNFLSLYPAITFGSAS